LLQYLLPYLTHFTNFSIKESFAGTPYSVWGDTWISWRESWKMCCKVICGSLLQSIFGLV